MHSVTEASYEELEMVMWCHVEIKRRGVMILEAAAVASEYK